MAKGTLIAAMRSGRAAAPALAAELPALAAVPGVLCAPRFRGRSGNRKCMALCHLASPAVVESAEWKRARQSDRTSRCRPQLRDHLRLLLRAYARPGERGR